MSIGTRSLALPASVIPSLLTVVVMAPAHARLHIDDGDPWLSLGETRLPINDWWGRATDFPAATAGFDPVALRIELGEDEERGEIARIVVGDGTSDGSASPWSPGAKGIWYRMLPGTSTAADGDADGT